MKLTKRAIDSFQFKKGKAQDIRWDSSLPSFGLRIYPSGKKSFVLFYRHNGRAHMVVVGKYGVFTIDQARKKAKEMLFW